MTKCDGPVSVCSCPFCERARRDQERYEEALRPPAPGPLAEMMDWMERQHAERMKRMS